MLHKHLVPVLILYQKVVVMYDILGADCDVQLRRKLAVNLAETSWDRVDLDIYRVTLRPRSSYLVCPICPLLTLVLALAPSLISDPSYYVLASSVLCRVTLLIGVLTYQAV